MPSIRARRYRKIRGDGAAGFPTAGDQYDYVLANPPYFKLKREDPRRQAAEGFSATSNIYPVFVELCAQRLRLRPPLLTLIVRTANSIC